MKGGRVDGRRFNDSRLSAVPGGFERTCTIPGLHLDEKQREKVAKKERLVEECTVLLGKVLKKQDELAAKDLVLN